MENLENINEIQTGLNSLVEIDSNQAKNEKQVDSKTCEEFFEADQELALSEEDEEEIYYDLSTDDLIETLLESVEESPPQPTQSNNNIENINRITIEQNVIDSVINQRRNEIALELRRLQFINRQSTRYTLETFVSQAVGNSQPIFRTQNIQNEITELGSIRRVTDVLSNSRNRIERALQNMLGNRNNLPVTQRLNSVNTPRNQETQLNNNDNVEQNQMNQLNNQNSNRVLPWLNQNSNTNTFEQLSREQILEEISELVHRQLVSNVLHSEFRPVLERRVMDRLRQIGDNGEQTREFIRNLRSNRNIARNDFSTIGINRNNQDLNDMLDSASSQSEHRVQRSVFHNSRDIKDLKKELNELKNLMQVSFGLQLEMQRSLKQEINALISNTFHNSISANFINSSKPFNVGKCLICTESEADTVYYQCGHICSCYLCSMNLKQKNHDCPVCRAPINDIIRVYRCSLE